MEERILQIITKLRQIFVYGEPKRLMEFSPSITLQEVGGKLELSSIVFYGFSQLIFYPTKVVYVPEFGDSEVLMEFETIDEFLNM